MDGGMVTRVRGMGPKGLGPKTLVVGFEHNTLKVGREKTYRVCWNEGMITREREITPKGIRC